MAYIISELHGQYGGKIAVAEQMILQSKFGGADAVKGQLYSEDFDKNSMDGDSPGDFLSLTFEELKSLKEYADMLHIDFFASFFDEERMQWGIDLDLPYLKIANWISREKPELVEKSIATGKKVIISLNNEQAKKGKPYEAENVIYLYTEPLYPGRLEDMHIPNFVDSWFSGYSDHTIGNTAATYALARGAKILEKHFTVGKSWQKTKEGGHACSMDVDDLRQLHEFARGFSILEYKKVFQYES